MQQSSLPSSTSALKIFSACLLSYLLIMMPLVSFAAGTRLKPQLRSETSDAGQKSAASEKANASAKNVFFNVPVPQPAPEPLVPSITATKTDALISDDGDGKADPGNTEKIEYTVTITNTGTDATNVQFTDTIDTHTTLVNGSITTQPIAVNDSYNVLGNVRIQPNAAAGVLTNDCDPDPLGGPCTNAGLTASGPTAGPAHGQATVNGDGSFTYNPTAGYEGPDSFTYTVTDGTGKTDTATVNLTVTGMIWFINSAAAAGGDGRLTTPFNCITGAGCFDSVAADDPGDNIFLFSGTYNDTAALVLLTNQKLIGAGATATLASIAGVTVPPNSDALPATNSNPATVTITSSVTGITLASGNTLRGFTVGNTGTAAGNYDIANTTTATVGTLAISDCVLNGTGGLFRADSGGTLNVTFNSADTTNAGSNGVQLNNTTGSFTINGSGTISGVTGVNFLVSGGSPAISCSSNLTKTSSGRVVDFSNYDTATATISGNLSCTSSCSGVQVTNDGSSSGTVNFSGGTKTLNTSTNTAVNLDNNDGGTVNFTNGGLDIDTTSGSGFNAINGGTVTVQGSSNTITSTTGTGLNVANTTIGASGLTFQSINVDGTDAAPTNGIVLNSTGTSGGLSVTGTGSAGTGGTIRDASGNGISLTTTEKVSLSFVNITSNLGSGIGGSGINGLQIASCSITSNGDSAASDESGINVTQLTGTNSAGARPTSITNTTISNNFEFQIQITNSSGTLTDLTMSGNTISNTAPAVSGNLFNFVGNGSASMKLTVTSGSFTGNWTPAAPIPGPAVISGTAISAVTQGTGGHTVNVSGATFTNNNAGVDCSTTNVSNTFSCNVSNNNFQGSRAVAINSFHNGNAPFTRTFNGTFSNNIIGTIGNANSGSFNGRGIDISNEGVITTANYTISGNTIAEVGTLATAGAEGIGVNVGLGGQATGGGATNVTISGNTIRDIRNSRALIVSDNQDPAFAPFPTICANISGNTFTGTIAGQAGNGQFMRIRELSGTVNVTQAQATAAANAAELDDANGFNDTTKISISGTPQFSQPACTTSTALPSTSALEPLQYGPSNSSELAAIEGIISTVETSTNTEVSKPSLWARAFNAIASITEEVGSLIEPTAYASTRTETAANRGQLSGVKSHHAYLANAGRKSGQNNHKPEVRTHVARSAPTLTAPVAGEAITINIGTLRQNDSVTITFQVTVNNPPNLTLLNPPRVRNQGTVTADVGISVMTDDTAVVGAADPTDTPVDLFDTTTTLVSDVNPSNFGDQVTFTATVAENPTQGSADPTGTVDFIDTSNGNAVICNDVALNGSFQAQCQTSALTASTHNIRADYSGDGNFDPSQSNVVAQVVIACGPTPVVTKIADTNDGVCDADCSLREAIATACSGATITFNEAGVFATPQTITLGGTELNIDKNLTIDGPDTAGHHVTIDGNNASRVFNINVSKTATILDLTVTKGKAANGAAGGAVGTNGEHGGAILNDGTLTLTRVNITNSHAGNGGNGTSTAGDGGRGGAIYTTGSLTLVNSALSGNGAGNGGDTGGATGSGRGGDGGAIFIFTGGASLTGTTISTNTAGNSGNDLNTFGGMGGGIFVRNTTTVTIKSSAITNNASGTSNGTDGFGGGIQNEGLLTAVSSEISGNTTEGPGGGIINRGTGNLTLVNSTISGNTAAGGGHGLYNDSGTTMVISNCTITNNSPSSSTGVGVSTNGGPAQVGNTIIASNGGASGSDVSGTFTSQGNNLIGKSDGTNGFTNGVNGDQVGTLGSPINALLGALANNGGPTQTHRLLTGSPAIEAGNNAIVAADTLDLDGDLNTSEPIPFDQRGTGFPRVADSADANTTATVDIGAFEFHPSIEDITDKTTAEDTAVPQFSFNVGDGTGALIASVIATSGNTTLVPNANLVIGGSGSTRTLDITPAANANSPANGTATITVTVTATNGQTATDTFVLTVTEVNDNPDAVNDTLTAVNEDSGTRIIPFADLTGNDTAGPANESGQTITVTGVSVPVGGTVIINGTNVEFTPTANFAGAASFNYTITDNGTTNGVADPKTDTATASFTINAVNDPPVNTVPGPQGTNQNTPLVFSSGNGNQISVADPDAGTNTIQVTLTVTNGTLTLSGTSGLSFSFSDGNGTGAGDGTADATMTFRGTLTNINAALNGMTFTPTLGFSGAASLTITSNDLGNTGSGGPLTDTDVVNIQVSTNISIQDAQVVEPTSGPVNMIFTVTLSAPAPAGGTSVNFTTMDEVPPSLTHATAGLDYTTTSGTVTFATGQQLKTIQVPVLSDNLGEQNETFLVVLSTPVNGTIADGMATGTILNMNQPGAVLISELRTSGPAGAGDDFVEIYNNSNSPHTVNGSAGGYGLFKMGADCSATPVLIGVIPNGTVIPARGHYLFVGSAYSLANYGGTGAAAGDQTLSTDIESDRNVALFSTAALVGISTATRLDGVGFGSNTGGTCDLLREGTTLTSLSGSVLEYSYFRDECGKKGNPAQFGPCPTGGFVADTNVNGDDFVFADTIGTATPAGQRLGAPGPQNLGSPRLNLVISALLLDATKGAPAVPNRVRDFSVVPNGAQGTLSIRRRFVNNTGAPVTRLRFRIVDISALTTGGIADLRALTSTNLTVTGVADSATCLATGTPSTVPCQVTVQGTTLETPPAQPLGGALNSSLTTGTITLGTPLAPGASINLQLLLGVQATGSFKFFFNVEALP